MTVDPQALRELFHRRLLFVTGKGGVGKSIVSAAAAVDAARQGLRTLWVEMSESPKGGYMFEGYRPDYQPRRVEDNLWAMNLRFQPAIEEYLEIIFRMPFVSRSIARNSLFRVFTTALPGLDALVTTGKIWYEAERAVQQKPYWDRIVVDAPATGHGLALLKFPHAALDIVQSGPIADRARDIDRMLGDRQNTSILVVSLLEALPVDEAVELIAGIRADTGYDVGGVVMNGVFPDVGTPGRERYQGWLDGGDDGPVAAALGSHEDGVRRRLRWLDRWRHEQLSLRPKLEALDTTLVETPWLPSTTEHELLEAMAQVLAGADAAEAEA